MDPEVPPRLVKASTFLAWWRRMIALERALPQDMTHKVWRTRGQPIRLLLSDLVEVAQVAGAVLPQLQVQSDGSVASVETLNPGFDWQGGTIDMQGRFGPREHDLATDLIARLVRMTGIPE